MLPDPYLDINIYSLLYLYLKLFWFYTGQIISQRLLELWSCKDDETTVKRFLTLSYSYKNPETFLGERIILN